MGSRVKYFYPLREIPQKARKEAKRRGEVCIERQVNCLRVLLVQRCNNCLYDSNRLQGREAESKKHAVWESDG